MALRISVVSFDALPLLRPSASGGIGGAEVRAVTFAKGLRQNDQFELSFVVSGTPGNTRAPTSFPVNIYQRQRPSTLKKLGRSLAKRIRGHIAADPFFSELDADALLCFGVRNDTASIIRSARAAGKKTILFLTSDRNIEDALRRGRKDKGVYGELGYLCRFAIEQADRVVAQSPQQLVDLRTKLDVDGVLIRNPICLSDKLTEDALAMRREPRPMALWVGRADTFSKRADLCVELARLCPSVQFRMIMNNHDSSTFHAIQESAPENVEIIERVPFADVETHFLQATMLVNTSSAEGFPNSFLQAAKYGRPIVALQVDPGEMFATHGCGYCADGDLRRMAANVSRLGSDPKECSELGEVGRRYVTKYHDATARCRELEELILGVCRVSREQKAA